MVNVIQHVSVVTVSMLACSCCLRDTEISDRCCRVCLVINKLVLSQNRNQTFSHVSALIDLFSNAVISKLLKDLKDSDLTVFIFCSYGDIAQRQAIPLVSVITFYRPSPVFSPVPAVSLYSLLPFRVSMPHCQQQGMCVSVCVLQYKPVMFVCLHHMFVGACIVLLQTRMSVTYLFLG